MQSFTVLIFLEFTYTSQANNALEQSNILYDNYIKYKAQNEDTDTSEQTCNFSLNKLSKNAFRQELEVFNDDIKTGSIKFKNQTNPKLNYEKLQIQKMDEMRHTPDNFTNLEIDKSKFSEINYKCAFYMKSLSNFNLDDKNIDENDEIIEEGNINNKNRCNDLLNEIFTNMKLYNLFMMCNNVSSFKIDFHEENPCNLLKRSQFTFTKEKKLQILTKILEVMTEALKIANIYEITRLKDKFDALIELVGCLIFHLDVHDLEYSTTIIDKRILYANITSIH